MAQEEALALAVRNVSKRFPGVQALDDVDSDLRQGKVHILLGENAAGKIDADEDYRRQTPGVAGGTTRPATPHWEHQTWPNK